MAAEDYTNRFASQIGFIRKHFKDIHKGYEELVSLSANLGMLYNGWSLQEEKLSEAIEKTGESVDITTVATQQLCLGIQGSLGMFLKEYEQLSKSVDKVLRWRHKKHAEFETLSESLVTKQTTLGKLESTEHESQRLNAVLSAEGISYTPPAGAHRSNGFLGAINSLIDSDPDTTRRKNISKTKDKISTIEEQREASRHQLIAANAAIQKELNMFQRQKVFDFRNALLSFAMSQRDYHRKVLNAWQENKGVVDKITV